MIKISLDLWSLNDSRAERIWFGLSICLFGLMLIFCVGRDQIDGHLCRKRPRIRFLIGTSRRHIRLQTEGRSVVTGKMGRIVVTYRWRLRLR